MKEYKVVKYKESFIKAILFGQSKISPKRFTKFLNKYRDEGWSAINIDKGIDTILLLFSRENYIVVLERDNKVSTTKKDLPLIDDEWKPTL